MMIFLFLIGTIFTRNALSKNYNQTNYTANNCSQTFFDEASLNYLASFNFHSKLIDRSCPKVKAIAFKKNDLLEIEMKIQIINEIWTLLSTIEKARLVTALRSRFHFSCNSQMIPTELCRSNHALDGGVYISTYDGSLMNHQIQKSCSVCLLKVNITRPVPFSKFDLSNPIIASLNLSVSDIVNLYDSTDDEIVSVKFIRSPDKSDLISKYLLKNIFGRLIIDKSISISASLFYNIRVKLNSKKFNKKIQKGASNNSDNCVFRCDWSSICLTNTSLICNNKDDCQYGDDENPYICQIFYNSNNKHREQMKNLKTDNSKLFGDHFSQNKENIPLILSIILLCAALLFVGIIVLVCVNMRNKNSNHLKKQMANKEFSQFRYDDPSFSSFYPHKVHRKDINGPLIVNEMLQDCPPRKDIHSGKCNSSIHKKIRSIHKKGKLITARYLKQNEMENNQQWDCNIATKPNDLCAQINYPDSMTKSSWLRSYFQMTKIRNQMYVKTPLVVNISKLSPMSFNCNN